MDVRIGLVSLGLGVAIETASLALGWRIYHPPWLRVVNVLLVFGIACSVSLSDGWRVRAPRRRRLRFAIGARRAGSR